NRTSEEGGIALAVAGALDAYTAPTLQDELRPLVRRPERIVLDLGALDFLDSTGLRVLVEAQNELSNSGGALQLRNVGDSTRRLLDITGLAELLGVEGRD